MRHIRSAWGLCLFSVSACWAGGSVQGTVKFDGSAPPAATKSVPAGHQDKSVCGVGDTVPDESLVVDKETHGIADVVVTLEPAAGGKAAAADKPKIVFDQKHCVFTEHVVVVPVGVDVEFKNSDTVSHNVKLDALLNKGFNITVEGGKSLVQKFDQEERMKVSCSIHPWMSGYLVAVKAPYYTKTDAKGAFKIDNLPAGTYKVRLWQERIGAGKVWNGPKEITVKESEAATADYKGSLKQQ